MHSDDYDNFYDWLIHHEKLSKSFAGSIVSHVKRLVEYGVPLDEDIVRSILWKESKYMRRNYVNAVRRYKRYLEWVEGMK